MEKMLGKYESPDLHDDLLSIFIIQGLVSASSQSSQEPDAISHQGRSLNKPSRERKQAQLSLRVAVRKQPPATACGQFGGLHACLRMSCINSAQGLPGRPASVNGSQGQKLLPTRA